MHILYLSMWEHYLMALLNHILSNKQSIFHIKRSFCLPMYVSRTRVGNLSSPGVSQLQLPSVLTAALLSTGRGTSLQGQCNITQMMSGGGRSQGRAKQGGTAASMASGFSSASSWCHQQWEAASTLLPIHGRRRRRKSQPLEPHCGQLRASPLHFWNTGGSSPNPKNIGGKRAQPPGTGTPEQRALERQMHCMLAATTTHPSAVGV